nr:hypothetical protein [Tanacetum cinerariifolium]
MKQIPAIDTAVKRSQNKDDLTSDDLKQYEPDIEEMNLILISVSNDIHNSMDACENERDMYDRVKRLMQARVVQICANVCLAKNFKTDTYDMLFNHLQQYEGLVNASRAKRTAKTHDPLALVANTHASSSSSRSPEAYYVTHPPFVVDYDNDYLGDEVCDDQEDSLTTIMMLLARAITQRYSTPTNNRLCTSSNIKNQVIMQADRVDIQNRNFRNGGRYTRRPLCTRMSKAKSLRFQILYGTNVACKEGRS